MKAVEKLENNYNDVVKIFKAMADETRIEIIHMLSDGELCACKILEKFDIKQPTLSYHMKILTDCGLVSSRRDGTWIRYSLRKESFKAFGNLLNDFYIKINKNQNINQIENCERS